MCAIGHTDSQLYIIFVSYSVLLERKLRKDTPERDPFQRWKYRNAKKLESPAESPLPASTRFTKTCKNVHFRPAINASGHTDDPVKLPTHFCIVSYSHFPGGHADHVSETKKKKMRATAIPEMPNSSLSPCQQSPLGNASMRLCIFGSVIHPR